MNDVEQKLAALQARGVVLVDPRQIYVDPQLDPERVCAGAVLYPGTRLGGARTFIGPGARVGTEGPAVLDDTVLGEGCEVASGYLSEAVLLRGAKAGANAHFRSGTLLEEEASVAHAVGLKQTILLSFVTLGSLINFCDVLMAGGTSRQDHSEVGSGFIHFNFTPWGKSGDKATPSLIGDVPRGVFLRERRIFLGGLGAIVGPQQVGYGALTVAGQVTRQAVAAGRMAGEVQRPVDRPFDFGYVDLSTRRLALNVAYIGQLTALRAFYQQVRLRRIPAGPEYTHLRVGAEAAIALLAGSIKERTKRLHDFARERGFTVPALPAAVPDCPLRLEPTAPYVDHVAWVQSLSAEQVEQGAAWLKGIVDRFSTQATGA